MRENTICHCLISPHYVSPTLVKTSSLQSAPALMQFRFIEVDSLRFQFLHRQQDHPPFMPKLPLCLFVTIFHWPSDHNLQLVLHPLLCDTKWAPPYSRRYG